MTNGFGRPTASRIAPRRNPSVAPAPTTGEGAPLAENEPTLLDDVQGVGEPTLLDSVQAVGEQASAGATQPESPADADATQPEAPAAETAEAPATADSDNPHSVDVEPNTDAQTSTTTPADDNTPPAAPADDNTPPAAPADDNTPPAAPETAQEPQPDTAEPPADTDTANDGETGSSDASTKPRKPRKTRSAPAADKATGVTAPTTNGGTSLVVIGPDGHIAVDDSVHVVDLRTVAAESNPHALVDQLTALAGISDSQVRADAVAAISEAITKVALTS